MWQNVNNLLNLGEEGYTNFNELFFQLSSFQDYQSIGEKKKTRFLVTPYTHLLKLPCLHLWLMLTCPESLSSNPDTFFQAQPPMQPLRKPAMTSKPPSYFSGP